MVEEGPAGPGGVDQPGDGKSALSAPSPSHRQEGPALALLGRWPCLLCPTISYSPFCKGQDTHVYIPAPPAQGCCNPTRNPDESFTEWVGTSSGFFDHWIPYLGPVSLFSNNSKVHLVKAMIFPVVMYGCESWTIKKAERRRIDAFELSCWRRLLRVTGTARISNQSILKEISPGYSVEGLMLKQNSNTLAT